MPERIMAFRVRASVVEASRACDQGMLADRWEPRDRPEDDNLVYMQLSPVRPPAVPSADIRLWCVERVPFRGLLQGGNQVVAEIALFDRGADGTNIVVGGACYGVGPIQQRHVDGRVASLVAAIKAATG